MTSSDRWLDYGKFMLNTALQRSKEWEEDRSKLGATSSDFGKIRLYMEGRGEKPSPPGTKIEMNDAMRIGNESEPHLRKWFQEKSGYLQPGSTIHEIGLAVPKFYSKIGGSTDGLILVNGNADGLIEIKTTAKMYESLTDTNRDKDKPETYISPWHYDQMQGCMAIIGMPYCYYIVYEYTTNTMHVEKVPFNSEYWNSRLYPAIYYYIENGFSRERRNN